jgi:hypothetical protein
MTVFQGGDDGRGYRNMCKIPRGSNSNQGADIQYLRIRTCLGPRWLYSDRCIITVGILALFFQKHSGPPYYILPVILYRRVFNTVQYTRALLQYIALLGTHNPYRSLLDTGRISTGTLARHIFRVTPMAHSTVIFFL